MWCTCSRGTWWGVPVLEGHGSPDEGEAEARRKTVWVEIGKVEKYYEEKETQSIVFYMSLSYCLVMISAVISKWFIRTL